MHLQKQTFSANCTKKEHATMWRELSDGKYEIDYAPIHKHENPLIEINLGRSASVSKAREHNVKSSRMFQKLN